jgi:hypothetical protein
VTGTSLDDAPASLWYEELYRMLDDAPSDALVTIGAERSRKDSVARKDMGRYWWDLVHELSKLCGDERSTALDTLRSQWRLPKDWRMYDPGDARGERRHRLLNRTELRHPILAQMPSELAEREIQECRAGLESYLQREVWALAYPFGHEGSAGAREMTMAERAGYVCAFLNYGGGLSRRTSSRFALPRAHVTAQMDLPEFEAHLSGFHDGLQRRFRGSASQSARGQVP